MTRLARDGVDPETNEPRWSLTFEAVEATVIGALPARLAALLGDPDGNRRIIDRLFPPAYADAEQEREHRKLLSESLLEARQQMLSDVTALLAGARRKRSGALRLQLVPAGLDLLLRFLNDVRLVLATGLGIEKNLQDERVSPSHPDAPRYALLEYLGHVESILVEAAASES